MSLNFESFLKHHYPKLPLKPVQVVMELSQQGATVPFIARYRKEKTGNLDEVSIRKALDAREGFEELVKRQAFILKEVEAQGNLTADLKKHIQECLDLNELEELYRPYKKKKKTKAKIARDAGLEPFADWLWQLAHGEIQENTALEVKAKEFINAKEKFPTYQEVLKGAQDILVEKLTNNQELRALVRENLFKNGKVISKKGKKYKDKSKYEMYTDFQENVQKLLVAKNSHRYMAMRRGWGESELTLSVQGDQDMLEQKFFDFCTHNPPALVTAFMQETAKNALNLHVMPSISNEVHKKLKEASDEQAIKVFAENVKKVLLASPLGPKCILGIDPGLRTGAKVALVDKNGFYISHTVLNILGDDAEVNAEKLLKELFDKIQVEAIAVGNGTAGRETEIFIRKILKKLEKEIPVVMVSESGASVYSASEVAREEFPDLDLTVRGAISIARRLQDPLAELVKIDPQSIGVGQYQHDVSPAKLKKSLSSVVESCVNQVGVDLHTASTYLLQHISGIGPAIAKNITEFRKTNGLFKDRLELNNVPQFSSKAFEQAAGFLRVNEGDNVLDKTGIHPERYTAVKEMAKELGLKVSELVGENAKKLNSLKDKWIELVGEYTFDDIVRELEKPGRDPRDTFQNFSFRDDIFEVKDLKTDMICPGIVTNVTSFGAFVDIGVHQDGLVHISEITHDFVEDPSQILSPGDQVQVKVMKVDEEKKQVFLTMKLTEKPKAKTKAKGKGKSQGKRSPKNVKGKPKGKGRGPKGKGGKPGFKGKPRKPKQSFNNPFAAALGDLKK